MRAPYRLALHSHFLHFFFPPSSSVSLRASCSSCFPLFVTAKRTLICNGILKLTLQTETWRDGCVRCVKKKMKCLRFQLPFKVVLFFVFCPTACNLRPFVTACVKKIFCEITLAPCISWWIRSKATVWKHYSYIMKKAYERLTQSKCERW